MSLRPKSLRHKIIAIVSAVVVLYALADHLIQRATVSPSFEALEREEATEDVLRCVEAIQNEIDHLDMLCRGRAAWDDTYRFVQILQGEDEAALAERRRTYVASNLCPTALQSENVNLVYVCDLEGRVVWGAILDLETGERLRMRDLPDERLAPGHPLLARLVEDGSPASGGAQAEGPGEGGFGFRSQLDPSARLDHVAGLAMTEHGPMLISARPILTSEGRGPCAGTVIMGRFLGEPLVEALTRRTRVRFSAWPIDGGRLPPAERELLDRVTASTAPVVEVADREWLHVYTTVADMREAPALLVRADVERDITARGATSVRYALLSTIAAGLLLLLVLLGVLQKTVLLPIGRLTAHAVAIGQSDDTGVRLGLERDDEIGILSREFDGMLEKLAASRAAVVKAARAAGMSEIATGILHNVGNVLNSVNVSATVIGERVSGSKVAKLRKLGEMVEQHAEDFGAFVSGDPRGRHVAPFVVQLSREMTAEQEEMLGEVRSLSEGIEHIRRLVDSQQSFAARSELREPTSVDELLESALLVSRQSLSSSLEVEIERDWGDLPRLRLDRHKLMEILVNVLKNALQSLQEAAGPHPRLVLRARRDGARLVVEVADNGVGIPRENLARIFTHGFTTKKGGHGFGLHASANAATEMDGRLSAASEGPGRGASFTLEVPCEAVRLAA